MASDTIRIRWPPKWRIAIPHPEARLRSGSAAPGATYIRLSPRRSGRVSAGAPGKRDVAGYDDMRYPLFCLALQPLPDGYRVSTCIRAGWWGLVRLPRRFPPDWARASQKKGTFWPSRDAMIDTQTRSQVNRLPQRLGQWSKVGFWCCRIISLIRVVKQKIWHHRNALVKPSWGIYFLFGKGQKKVNPKVKVSSVLSQYSNSLWSEVIDEKRWLRKKTPVTSSVRSHKIKNAKIRHVGAWQ